MSASRRAFLKTGARMATALGGAASASQLKLGMSLAAIGALAHHVRPAAAASDDYKALVCLFMAGGNDSHNWVVPLDSTQWASYQTNRKELALSSDRLMAINAAGQANGSRYGMPTDLAPLRELYQSGQCAIAANVGALDRPTTKLDYQAGRNLPRKLFSHNDQASFWQSLGVEGAPSGWGGRLGDAFASANANPIFTSVSACGNAVFLTGQSVNQYQVGLEGPTAVTGLQAQWLHGSSAGASALRRAMAVADATPFQNQYATVTDRSLSAASVMSSALGSVAALAVPTTRVTTSVASSFDPSQCSLHKQLRIVARMAAAGKNLGLRRQVFMVQLGGFDTHNNQMRDQPLLMARVASGIQYFMSGLGSLGLANNVTLFTASEFGRTLVSNGDGSDHGWGSHHFIVGGAVQGGQMLGTFPNLALNAEDDVGSGRMLPSTSVSQLAASLGGWMGLGNSELLSALPGVERFSAQSSWASSGLWRA